MAGTIDKFKDAVKARLRDNKDAWYEYSRDTDGGYHFINWDELDKDIDEFAAEFQKQERDSKPPR